MRDFSIGGKIGDELGRGLSNVWHRWSVLAFADVSKACAAQDLIFSRVQRNTGTEVLTMRAFSFRHFSPELFFKHVNWKMTAWWRFLTSKLNYENDTHSFNSAITKKLLKTQKLLQWRTANQILGVDPLHPNISKHILHTVLYTFPKLLTRRIWLTIKSFFSWWSFPLLSWPWWVI